MVVDVPQLLEMSSEELDELFKASPPGKIPDGEADGTVLVATGTQLAGPAEKVTELLAWKGKVFDAEKGELLNKVGPLGTKSIRAQVYKQASWLDGKDTIVLDYSKTSVVARWIRDEIREVSPGLYLGLVYWERTKILHFALKFPS